MKKREYVDKAKQSILNKVKFHAPIVFDGRVDKNVLIENGINPSLPIFKFDKMLTKPLIEAFVLAQREERFNLVLPCSSVEKIKQNNLKKLKNLMIYSAQNVSVRFLEMINKLNINYQSSSNYNLVFKDKFFKVNGEILNPQYKEFCLWQKACLDGITLDYREFVLNGSNFFCQFQNKTQQKKVVEVELNVPLAKGYYYFKRQQNSIRVENLLTKEVLFLNFVARNASFSFSDVDGLENSVFSCVNARLKLCLSANEKKFVFFNISSAKFSLKNFKEIKEFEQIALQKSCEIFDVRVKTKNPKFDQFFNINLPKKIWINWLNGQIDEELEQKYVNLKRLFVVGKDKISFVPFKQIGLRELGIFNGEYYKKIYIVRGDEKFLKVGKTAFYNINGVSEHSLKSREPICLSFGF